MWRKYSFSVYYIIILISPVAIVWQYIDIFVYILYISQCKFVCKLIMAYRLGGPIQFGCGSLVWNIIFCYRLDSWIRTFHGFWGIPLQKVLCQGNQYVIYVLLSAEPRASSGTLRNTVLLMVRLLPLAGATRNSLKGLCRKRAWSWQIQSLLGHFITSLKTVTGFW